MNSVNNTIDQDKFKIDWSGYWDFKPHASLFDLALLSLGYNPEYAKLISTTKKSNEIEWEAHYLYYLDWFADSNSIETRDNEVIKRMTLIFDNAVIGCYHDEEVLDRYGMIGPFSQFYIPLFAKWAKENDLKIPQELLRLGFKNIKNKNHDSNRNKKEEDKSKLSRGNYQEEKLLEIIKTAGFDPLKLPPIPKGTRWIKADLIKIALDIYPTIFTESSFNKTWERLRSSGLLKDVSSVSR